MSNFGPPDMSAEPELPQPAYAEADSMLTRRVGFKEAANYFSGSPLNRVSFLRGDHAFLTNALKHPTTTFILFDDLKPLTPSPANLAYFTLKDVQPLIGDNPYEKTEAEMIAAYDSRVIIPQMIFLGLDERNKNGLTHKVYTGAPMFAVDVTPKAPFKEAAEKLIEDGKAKGLDFLKDRMILSLSAPEAAIYAQARALLDWNNRNPFCAACGGSTVSMNAGGKRVCPPADAAVPGKRGDCITRTTISNLSFPRTDPTVIMAVVSSDGTRIMLGRQKRWPAYFYSTLAGFCEPAESIEEAVRREVWEEAGVLVGRVVIHSTQPWPYPSNLMIGAIGQATPEGERLDLGNDPELDNAKWYSFEEVREALEIGTSGLGDPPGPGYKEGGLRLPPKTAIANQLITSVVGGFVTGDAKM